MPITSEPTLHSTAPDTPYWQFAVASGVLGWVLDAFDFFVIVFLFSELATKFHTSKAAIVWSLTLTLAMRPIGAFFFGALADRYGRKKPLIACVLYFSTVTVLSGFAPNYTFFLTMRALYGIGMGGYWGIGASYAMESTPARVRGFVSGLMQGGYPLGNLCAALGMQFLAPHFGWQSLFFIGALVAVLIVTLTLFAPESEAWELHRSPSVGSMVRTIGQNSRLFLYMLVLMSVITSLSHGTQDLYPDFLKTLPFIAKAHVLGMAPSNGITILSNLAAIAGTLFFGSLSEKIGRRRAVMLSLTLCLLAMPAWAFGASLLTLLVGAVVMQAGVQGAFGVIPAHLNELSPAAIRGLFPGFVYQLGVLISSPATPLETTLQRHFGYSWALSGFELVVIAVLFLLFAFGPENRGKDFRAA
jgi:SHS family lactate transporter-like MFS transporter